MIAVPVPATLPYLKSGYCYTIFNSVSARAEKRSAFRHLYGRSPVPDVTSEKSGEVRVSRIAVAVVVRHRWNVSTFLARWNRLAPIGCGARVGGWARRQRNQRWRNALRFSAIRLLIEKIESGWTPEADQF